MFCADTRVLLAGRGLLLPGTYLHGQTPLEHYLAHLSLLRQSMICRHFLPYCRRTTSLTLDAPEPNHPHRLCGGALLSFTQPGLPLGVGHIRTKTHDYRRHGTITLFAALNYLDGKITSPTEEKHSNVEWLRFLKQIERETPKHLDLHLIVHNYGTHKHQNVKKWLAAHLRFHLHFGSSPFLWTQG